MLTATAKPSRVSRERKSAQPVRGGNATRTHRKIAPSCRRFRYRLSFSYILVKKIIGSFH